MADSRQFLRDPDRGPARLAILLSYAEDAGGGGRWAGDINMCVADNEFRIVGVEDCFARGFQRVGFKEYDTGRQGSWMVQLSDAPEAPESQN